MTVRIEGTEAYLEGDWTVSGVEKNLDSLMLSMNQLQNSGSKIIRINCGKIDAADTSGLQLLSVMIMCARLRGIEPRLVHVTPGIRRVIKERGPSGLSAYLT